MKVVTNAVSLDRKVPGCTLGVTAWFALADKGISTDISQHQGALIAVGVGVPEEPKIVRRGYCSLVSISSSQPGRASATPPPTDTEPARSPDRVDPQTEQLPTAHPHAAPVPTLVARTRAIADPGQLSRLSGDIAWIRRGEGMVARGRLARAEFDTIEQADAWWSRVSAAAEHRSDLPDSPAVGPLAFGSFTFDADNTAATSVLIVPEVIIGRRDGVCWITRIAEGAEPDDDFPSLDEVAPTAPGQVAYSDGALSGPGWETVVANAVERIRTGDVHKVVMARELLAVAEHPIDPRWLVDRLAAGYERCWTYSVDGLVGASPEMLVRRENGLVTSRVLAGTIWGTDEQETDLALASSLARSSKNLSEHEYAVSSVAQALAPYCSGMNVPDAPYVLELPNVFHLATDVTAVARPGASSLALAGALHPSAAVCGTPTDVARALITEIEQLDRGRYAGPVGWVDTSGDGEWAIALRCGKVEGNQVRLYAGCGIVADSDPATELAESVAKMVPMRDALEN